MRVITFNGGWDLPLWAAQRQGFFETNGVDVRLAYTPSSDALVAGLFDGRYDIALATIDNFIAYQEGQADVRIADATTDLVSFMVFLLGVCVLALQQRPHFNTPINSILPQAGYGEHIESRVLRPARCRYH